MFNVPPTHGRNVLVSYMQVDQFPIRLVPPRVLEAIWIEIGGVSLSRSLGEKEMFFWILFLV